jgi:hypothetical protein
MPSAVFWKWQLFCRFRLPILPSLRPSLPCYSPLQVGLRALFGRRQLSHVHTLIPSATTSPASPARHAGSARGRTAASAPGATHAPSFESLLSDDADALDAFADGDADSADWLPVVARERPYPLRLRQVLAAVVAGHRASRG